MTRQRTLISLLLLTLIALFAARPAWAQEPPDDELNAVWIEFEPYSFEQDGLLRGFSIDLIRAVASEMGVGLNIAPQSLTLPEMLQQIESGEADVSATIFFQTAEREAIMDFSPTASISGSQIIVPAGLQRGGGFLRTILSSTVLQIIATGMVILLIVAHIIWLLERRHNNPDFHHSYLRGVWDGFWWAGVTITTVGYGDKALKGDLGRVVALMWMFVGLFLIAAFVAEITTLLTVARLESGIDGPEDLRGMVVGTVRGSTFAEQLQERGIDPVLYDTQDEMETALEIGEVEAIVSEANSARRFVLSSPRSRFQLAGEPYSPVNMAFAFPPGSPNREPFAQALLTIEEDGRYAALRAAWFGE